MIKVVRVIREELLPAHVRGRLLIAQAVSRLLPYGFAPRLRTAIYRFGGVKIGRGSVIMGSLRLWGTEQLTIGENTTINCPCAICLDGPVTIGNNVLIGHDGLLTTGTHVMGPHQHRGGQLIGLPIVIEDGVWTGANVLILAGTTLGAGCVIGGGAVVTRDVPADTLAAGVPARFIKSLSD